MAGAAQPNQRIKRGIEEIHRTSPDAELAAKKAKEESALACQALNSEELPLPPRRPRVPTFPTTAPVYAVPLPRNTRVTKVIGRKVTNFIVNKAYTSARKIQVSFNTFDIMIGPDAMNPAFLEGLLLLSQTLKKGLGIHFTFSSITFTISPEEQEENVYEFKEGLHELVSELAQSGFDYYESGS